MAATGLYSSRRGRDQGWTTRQSTGVQLQAFTRRAEDWQRGTAQDCWSKRRAACTSDPMSLWAAASQCCTSSDGRGGAWGPGGQAGAGRGPPPHTCREEAGHAGDEPTGSQEVPGEGTSAACRPHVSRCATAASRSWPLRPVRRWPGCSPGGKTPLHIPQSSTRLEAVLQHGMREASTPSLGLAVIRCLLQVFQVSLVSLLQEREGPGQPEGLCSGGHWRRLAAGQWEGRD